MSLDRLQSQTGNFSVSPVATSDGYPGGITFGSTAGFAPGTAATSGGALIETPTPRSGTVPVIAGSGTISHSGCGVSIVDTAGAVTGIIVAVGVFHGQHLTILNKSANSLTMAAAGTSNVINGTGCVISATAAIDLRWNALDSRWYQVRAA